MCNLGFLCAGSAVFVVILLKLLPNKGSSRFGYKHLIAMALLLVLILVLDFSVSSGFISATYLGLLELASAVLLIAQCALVAFYCWHIIKLTGGVDSQKQVMLVIGALPLIADIFLLISNGSTHAVFAFVPPYSAIQGGMLACVPLLCIAFYVVTGALVALARRSSIRQSYLASAIFFAGVVLLALAFEVWDPSIRVLTFALVLGVSVLASAELNPYEYVDSLTHAYASASFRHNIQSNHRRKRRYSVIFVSIDRLSELRLIVGPRPVDDMLMQCANACRRIGRTRKIYRGRDSVFALFAYSHHEERRIVDSLERYFDKTRPGSDATALTRGKVVLVQQAEGLESAEEATQYLEFVMDMLQKGEFTEQTSAESVDLFLEHREIRRYLERAMEEDLFELAFQPSWNVAAKRFSSLEVLFRLPHPTMGAIAPDVFISIAENEGFISQLDRLQFTQTCRFISKYGAVLAEQGIELFKVNLSPVDLLDANLGEWLLETMREHGVDPARVQFEITETVATQYDDELAYLVDLLTSVGSSLSMDDFGTGYANLKMILELPFSVIKLDRSLLCDVQGDEGSRTLYSNIVDMLKGLGFTVVSEGAETKEQVDLLYSCGVDEIQGFYFAKPMSQEQLLLTLRGVRDREEGSST